MSLVVSLRTADGIVIAADSLATVRAQQQIEAEVEVQCPDCESKTTVKLDELPPITFPVSTFSFAQKVFPFAKQFAVGVFGAAVVNGMSVYSHVKQMEGKAADVSSVDEAAERVGEHFSEQLEAELGDKELPDEVFPLGVQVVGYRASDNGGDEPATVVVRIGNEVQYEMFEDRFGCTVSGDKAVATKLWDLGREDTRLSAAYANFSLQDALDYAEFLIQTTAEFQRFTNMLPTVGGETDIGLITPYSGFLWIKQKELAAKLEGAPIRADEER
jgi:hypothetical protein